MAGKAQKSRRSAGEFEEITIDALRGISIRFPGDVYWLAAWIAMSNLAASTPTSRRGITLLGLAKQFARLADSLEQPWTGEMVMARFREHGLEGNPVIRLPPEHAEAVATFFGDGGPSANRSAPRLESVGERLLKPPRRKRQ